MQFISAGQNHQQRREIGLYSASAFKYEFLNSNLPCRRRLEWLKTSPAGIEHGNQVGSEALKAGNWKFTFVWGVTPCKLVEKYQTFGGICYFHIQLDGKRCSIKSHYVCTRIHGVKRQKYSVINVLTRAKAQFNPTVLRKQENNRIVRLSCCYSSLLFLILNHLTEFYENQQEQVPLENISSNELFSFPN